MEQIVKNWRNLHPGIYSLHAIVSFYTLQRNFEIHVYGKGVRKIEDMPFHKIFHIATRENGNESKSVSNKSAPAGKVG